MIVDDSQVARAVLARMLAPLPEFEVVATACDAAEALDLLSTTEVDIVLLDVEMPGASGLQALPQIVASANGARILIVSSFCGGAAEEAARAFPAGAVETLPKPGSNGGAGRFSDLLSERLRQMGRCAPPAPAAEAPRLRPRLGARLGCLAIGASTGGLSAVTALIRGLPETTGAAMLVTQHLPVAFIPFFARQVETASARKVQVAEDGLKLAPDEIVIAPGDAHIDLERRGAHVFVRLRRDVSPSGCMPSVDSMLDAAARTYGSAAVGIVLSGMGKDGLTGSRTLAAAGGELIVQDRESSAVWGMPRAVAEAGLASAVLDPEGIARRIAARLEAR
jgi:two-component system chemotaxis response regulator CheB